jgi:exosortase/archaeosortase family protein
LISTAPLLERAIIFASGLPLALVANIARIAAMGMISEAFGQKTAEALFHDASGFVMALLALGLLLLELRWLKWVFDFPVPSKRVKPMFSPSTG